MTKYLLESRPISKGQEGIRKRRWIGYMTKNYYRYLRKKENTYLRRKLQHYLRHTISSLDILISYDVKDIRTYRE